MELRGAVVVVTGASSGIGEATALAFSRRGATVVLAARRIERLEELAARIEQAGGRALAWKCDITDPDAVVKLPGIVGELAGPTDVLVNSAGVPGGGHFEDLTHDQIEQVVRTNLLGVMHATRAFLPSMLSRGRGHVVNVASLAGLFPTPGSSLYSATKHGVVAFSESLHFDTEDRGVLITTVNPGFVVTEGFPSDSVPRRLLLDLNTVSSAVVKVVRKQIAPSYSIPRWAPPLRAFHDLTPPLYRWGARMVRKKAASNPVR